MLYLIVAGLGAVAALLFIDRFVKRPVLGLACVFVAASFLMSPWLPVVREKLALPELFMMATWVALLIRSSTGTPASTAPTGGQRQILLALIAFIAASVISFAANGVTGGRPTRMLVETMNSVYGGLMLWTCVTLIDNWRKWILCVHAWMAGALLVGAVSAWTMFVSRLPWAIDSYTGRISSTLRFENQVPAYVMPVFALALLVSTIRDVRPRLRVFYAATAIAIVIAVVGTGSRTGWILLLCGVVSTLMVAALFAAHTRVSRGWLAIALAALIGVVTAGAWSVLDILNQPTIQYSLADGQDDAQAMATRPFKMFALWIRGERALDPTRESNTRIALKRFPDHPVVGVGPGMFTITYGGDELHNSYLGALLELGVLGFLALMTLISAILIQCALSLRRLGRDASSLLVLGALIGFGMLLLYGMGMYGLRQRNFWLASGLMAALPKVVQSTPLKTRAAPRATPPPSRLRARPAAATPGR